MVEETNSMLLWGYGTGIAEKLVKWPAKFPDIKKVLLYIYCENCYHVICIFKERIEVRAFFSLQEAKFAVSVWHFFPFREWKKHCQKFRRKRKICDLELKNELMMETNYPAVNSTLLLWGFFIYSICLVLTA